MTLKGSAQAVSPPIDSLPFIRYGTGDRGVDLGEGLCECGFNGPAMRLTEGRDVNFIVLPDGSEINPRNLYDAFNFAFPHDRPGWSMIDSICAFQNIQEKTDLITVKVVPGPDYSDSLWPDVKKNLKAIHPELKLEVDLVWDLNIPLLRKGVLHPAITPFASIPDIPGIKMLQRPAACKNRSH